MKRFAVAAAFAFAAGLPVAASADVPKAKCEPKPEYPGRLAMQSDTRRRTFEQDLRAYQDCINAYLAERKAAMKAEEDAANQTITEYNALMKKINDDQKAASEN